MTQLIPKFNEEKSYRVYTRTTHPVMPDNITFKEFQHWYRTPYPQTGGIKNDVGNTAIS